ncbi:hypothetical protein T484DRAFT_1817429 [Baffinella frigidus]|nr:hypothetical protein T484DRAFT_1817429 [Cryptophyta sp. CCMP2293]
MPTMLEVLPPGCSKATGVVRAAELLGVTLGEATGVIRSAELLGVTLGEVLAMGDGENDLEMLQMVKAAGGRAVAMGNAVQSLKDTVGDAHVVAHHNDGGAAEALERYVLAGAADYA